MVLDIKRILEGTVAVPYSQEVLDCLKSSCTSFMKDDADFAKLEEVTGIFLSGQVIQTFKDVVMRGLEEKALECSIPDNVLTRLSLFAICSCFDSADEMDKAIRATLFMNYLIVKKNQYDSLPNSSYIKEIYQWHLSHYLADNDSLPIGENTCWIEKIAGEGPKLLQNGISDEDDVKHIQMLVKEASFYRVRTSVEAESVQNIKNPYVRMYKGLSAMMGAMGYLYYNHNVQNTISLLVRPEEEGKGKKKKLASFIDEIRQVSGAKTVPELDSSILLRLIHQKDAGDLSMVLEMSFSVREFATYLYYELLLEKITQKQSE